MNQSTFWIDIMNKSSYFHISDGPFIQSPQESLHPLTKACKFLEIERPSGLGCWARLRHKAPRQAETAGDGWTVNGSPVQLWQDYIKLDFSPVSPRRWGWCLGTFLMMHILFHHVASSCVLWCKNTRDTLWRPMVSFTNAAFVLQLI
jgi:hypothetical protein